MGYRKWQLGQGDQYQTLIAAREASGMLCARANDCDGAFAMASEIAGVDGWDDLVVFSSAAGRIQAKHIQAKRQYRGFGSNGEEAFRKLFQDAQQIINEPAPYGQTVVGTADRAFVFVFPIEAQEVSVPSAKPLCVVDLKKLCEACIQSSASQIGTNRGSNLDSGQRRWLESVANALGDDFANAARVISQCRVEILSEESAKRDIERSLAGLYVRTKDAFALLTRRLQEAVPEGRLGVSDILQCLQGAGPKPLTRAVHLGVAADDVYVEGLDTICTGATEVAEEIVGVGWTRNASRELRICIAIDDAADEDTKTSFARLLLHAEYRPARVLRCPTWYEFVRRLTANTTGGTESEQIGLDDRSYGETARRMLGSDVPLCSVREMATALERAMDQHVRERIRMYCDGRVKQVPDLARGLQNVREILDNQAGLFQRVLRGWWERKWVRGQLRAGPCAAERVGLAYMALAAIDTAAVPLRTPRDGYESAVAELGDEEVRVLAIHRYSQETKTGEWARCGPEEVAQELVQDRAVVVLCHGDTELIVECAARSSRWPGARRNSFCDPVTSAVLVNAEVLVGRARQFGVENARRWFDDQRRKQVETHRSSLAEAVTQWRESDGR